MRIARPASHFPVLLLAILKVSVVYHPLTDPINAEVSALTAELTTAITVATHSLSRKPLKKLYHLSWGKFLE